MLSDLYRQIFGKTPTTKEPLQIAAWYLTHSHGDHYRNFYNFCTTNGTKIRVDYLIANFASDTETYNCYDPNPYLRDNLPTYASAITGGVK